MKKPLGIVLNNFGTKSEIFLLQFFKGLLTDYEITIYVLGKIDRLNEYFQFFKIKSLPKPKSFGFLFFVLKGLNFKTPLKTQFQSYILNLIKEECIYFPFIGMTRSFAKALSQKNGKKIYTSIRGTDITITPYFKPEVLKVYKQLEQHLHKVHFLSNELQQVTHEYGIRMNKEMVICQGVDTKRFFFNKNLKTDKLRIVTVGRLHYVKGLEFAILAAKELKQLGVDFEFIIIGDGEQKNKLTFLLKDLGLTEEVKLVSSKTRTEIIEYLKNANTYVHTHLVNGISNTMLEALASNLKVVIFNSNLQSYQVPFLTEVITEVSKFDYKEMALALKKISEKANYGNDEKVTRDILHTFSLDNHTEKFRIFFSD